jgi:hypothetical protein
MTKKSLHEALTSRINKVAQQAFTGGGEICVKYKGKCSGNLHANTIFVVVFFFNLFLLKSQLGTSTNL